MPIEITVRSHLRGALASHLEALLTEKLRSLPDISIQEEGPPDEEVFFAGGVVQADGYRDPTFVLVTAATKRVDPDLREDRIPSSLPADDRYVRLGGLEEGFKLSVGKQDS